MEIPHQNDYNYFRDYDPQVGRFAESDPIGLRGGINTYAYTNSSPIGRADPNGLDSVPLQSLVHPPVPGIPTVICDGYGSPIPQIPPLNPITDKCVGDCMLVHENSHIDDIISLGYGAVCHGQPRGTVVTLPATQALASEKKAYAAEVACLQQKLQGLSDFDVCRRPVTDRLNRIKQYATSPP